MLQYLVFLGAFVTFAGAFHYLIETLQGKNQPNRVSFLLWGTAPLIGAIAAYSDGVRLALIPVLFEGLTPLMILLASFYNKNAYWKLQGFDYACGAVSVLALILWIVTKDPYVTILFAILADVFASIPTLKKSWTDPDSETASAYYASIFAQFTAVFALQAYSFSELAFPMYFCLMNVAIVSAIYFGKRKKKLSAF